MLRKDSKIYVAGHLGMVGSAIVRRLISDGYTKIITRTSEELDLRRQADVEEFFDKTRPDVVFIAAAKVGGIQANNTYRAEFINDNLAIELNVINSAWLAGVKDLVFFSSSCAYPRNVGQPMSEEALWTGKLEPTNEPYAVAKLAGMSLCQSYNEQYGLHYFSVIPTNLYGMNDDYDPENSHVIAALISKFHFGKIENQPFVTLWGSGTPKREFLYVDDAIDAVLFLINRGVDVESINIGYGSDIEIRELAEIISNVVGYQGEIQYDSSKPDGAPRKFLDCNKIRTMGWTPKTPLESGLALAYQDFLRKLAQTST